MIPDTILECRAAAHFGEARALFEESAAALGVELCFQDFGAELESIDRMYAPPAGALFLAPGAGCVGVRRFDTTSCELKRLYVRPAGRGRGLGQHLTALAIERARTLGYARMLLDTLPGMDPAEAIYRGAGFVEIAAYYPNPLAGARYMKLALV